MSDEKFAVPNPDDGLPNLEAGQEAELVCTEHDEDGVRVFWDGEVIVIICRTCEDVLATIRRRDRIH